jgi:hypothetical protein
MTQKRRYEILLPAKYNDGRNVMQGRPASASHSTVFRGATILRNAGDI